MLAGFEIDRFFRFLGKKEVRRLLVKVEGQPHAEMPIQGMVEGQQPEGGIAAIIKKKVAFLGMSQMIDGVGPFALGQRRQIRIQPEAVIEIVERGKQAHGAVMGFRSEMSADIRFVGQFNFGAVNGQQAKTKPFFLTGKLLLKNVQRLLVQFDEGGGFQFLARLGQSGGGHETLAKFSDAKDLEKMVQFILKGAFELVEQERHQAFKSQFAIAREILVGGAMPSDEQGIGD